MRGGGAGGGGGGATAAAAPRGRAAASARRGSGGGKALAASLVRAAAPTGGGAGGGGGPLRPSTPRSRRLRGRREPRGRQPRALVRSSRRAARVIEFANTSVVHRGLSRRELPRTERASARDHARRPFEMVEPARRDPGVVKMEQRAPRSAPPSGTATNKAEAAQAALTASQVDEDALRAAMEIQTSSPTAAGRWRGDKIRIMRNMMGFLVKRALRTGDNAIVDFDAEVTVPLRAWRTIDAEGKGAENAREASSTRSTTAAPPRCRRGLAPASPSSSHAVRRRRHDARHPLFTDGARQRRRRRGAGARAERSPARCAGADRASPSASADDAEEEMLKTIAETTQGHGGTTSPAASAARRSSATCGSAASSASSPRT